MVWEEIKVCVLSPTGRFRAKRIVSQGAGNPWVGRNNPNSVLSPGINFFVRFAFSKGIIFIIMSWFLNSSSAHVVTRKEFPVPLMK